MPTMWTVTRECPWCDDAGDVWLFVKPEGVGVKECYRCEDCGREWVVKRQV